MLRKIDCVRAGCTLREPTFDVAIGKGAVLEDPFGNVLCLLDMSRGPRPTAPSGART